MNIQIKNKISLLSLWIKASYLYFNNSIIERYNLLNPKIQIFSLYIQDERVHVLMKNLFVDTEEKLHSLLLISKSKVLTGQWTHIALSYHAHSGRVDMYINGIIEESRYAKNEKDIWILSHQKKAAISIAKKFFGCLDENSYHKEFHSSSIILTSKIFKSTLHYAHKYE